MKMAILCVLLAIIGSSFAGDFLTVTPATVHYDVVPQRPALYSAPPVHVGSPFVQTHTPVVGTYAIHTAPAVSHHYSHTQTHPIAYVKPVNVYGGQGQVGHAYQPSSSSSIHQSRIYPQRLYQFQAYTNAQQQQPTYGDSQNSFGQNGYSNGYSSDYQNGYNQQQQYNDQNVGVKTRRYQIRRPAIQKEFYDIEEKIVVRPAGSALIEIDSPTVRPIENYDKNRQFNNGGRKTNYDNSASSSFASKDCDQTQSNTYSPSTFSSTDSYSPTTYSSPGQFSSTGFTSSSSFPTTTPQYSSSAQPTYASTQPPSRTYQPPFNDQNSGSGQFSTSSSSSETTPTHQDIFISSTTPVSVTIVDNGNDRKNFTNEKQKPNQNGNGNGNFNYGNRQFNNSRDIVYARDGGRKNFSNESDDYDEFSENEPEQIRGELPPRGDTGPASNDYRETDQFFHELPRGYYTAPYQSAPIHVEARSNGEPTDRSYYTENVNPQYNRERQPSRAQPNDNKHAKLIELFTGRSRVAQYPATDDPKMSGKYTNDNNYQNANQNYNQNNVNGNQNGFNGSPTTNGNAVRARIVSSTPAPSDASPAEHFNTRRVVVAKEVFTVQEVEVPDNGTDSTSNGQYGNSQFPGKKPDCDQAHGSSNFNQNQDYGQNQFGNDFNANQNYQASANYENGRGFSNDRSAQQKQSSTGQSGYYISTTPSTASQRIIYVKPVTQGFAQRRGFAERQQN